MSHQHAKDVSMLDPQVSSDPFDFYALLHQQSPVYQLPETGHYVVTKYADVRRVLKDHASFSNNVKLADRAPFADLHQSILRDGGGWEHVQTLQRTCLLYTSPSPKRRRGISYAVFCWKKKT